MIGGSTTAGELVPVSTMPGFSAFDSLGAATRNFSPVAKANYCTRDCDYCRSACYNTYRVNCYGPGCRQSFTLCMRDCWYNVCKWC